MTYKIDDFFKLEKKNVKNEKRRIIGDKKY
jgi:hypothetical protein